MCAILCSVRKRHRNRQTPLAAPSLARPVQWQKTFIRVIALAILFVILFFAFATRNHAIHRPHPFSPDEMLYNYLGNQFVHEPFNYASSGFYKEFGPRLRNPHERERVRQYMDAPLFKHPPLFPYLLALAKALFGSNVIVSNYVSLFAGLGIIAVVYLICRTLWGLGWGLLGAFFMTLEPVMWLCSQKIWIEATNALFIMLAVLFLILGRKNGMWHILSSISLGCALLCKYPSALILISIYAVLLFTNTITDRKMLLAYICLPFIIGAPWVAWSYAVYGSAFASEAIRLNAFTNVYKVVLLAVIPTVLIVTLFLVKVFFPISSGRMGVLLSHAAGNGYVRNGCYVIVLVAVAAFFFRSASGIAGALGMRHIVLPIPMPNTFVGQPHYFYFYHMIELSGICLFSYLSVLFFKKWDRWVILMALISFAVLEVLGKYVAIETRYIAIATPALVVLAVYTVKELFSYALQLRSGAKAAIIFLTSLAVVYTVIKTLYFDLTIIQLNNFFFF